MWYRDLNDSGTALDILENYFDVGTATASCILAECKANYAVGLAGKAPEINPRDDREIRDLIYDAWVDGIQSKSRVVVRLDDTSCDSVCTDCGCTEIGRNVMVTVSAPFAAVWADNDQTIDGSSWETLSPNEVYTILIDRANLAKELRADGYKLDLTNYTGVES